MLASQILHLKIMWFAKTPLVFLQDTEYRGLSLAEWRTWIDVVRLGSYEAEYFDCEVATETAWGLGLFYADGSCGLRNNKKAGAYWRIVNRNKDYLEKAKAAFEKEWPHLSFPIMLYPSYVAGTPTNLGERKHTLYCLEIKPQQRKNDGSRGMFIERFRNTLYLDSEKKVPAGILESSLYSKKAFLEGVLAGDGSQRRSSRFISVHGQTALSQLIKLAIDLHCPFYYRKDGGNNNYRLYLTRPWKRKHLEQVGACDDFAWVMAAEFKKNRINGIGYVLGSVPGGGHAWNIILANEGIYFLEPQTSEIFKGGKGYRAWAVIL